MDKTKIVNDLYYQKLELPDTIEEAYKEGLEVMFDFLKSKIQNIENTEDVSGSSAESDGLHSVTKRNASNNAPPELIEPVTVPLPKRIEAKEICDCKDPNPHYALNKCGNCGLPLIHEID